MLWVLLTLRGACAVTILPWSGAPNSALVQSDPASATYPTCAAPARCYFEFALDPANPNQAFACAEVTVNGTQGIQAFRVTAPAAHGDIQLSPVGPLIPNQLCDSVLITDRLVEFGYHNDGQGTRQTGALQTNFDFSSWQGMPSINTGHLPQSHLVLLQNPRTNASFQLCESDGDIAVADGNGSTFVYATTGTNFPVTAFIDPNDGNIIMAGYGNKIQSFSGGTLGTAIYWFAGKTVPNPTAGSAGVWQTGSRYPVTPVEFDRLADGNSDFDHLNTQIVQDSSSQALYGAFNVNASHVSVICLNSITGEEVWRTDLTLTSQRNVTVHGIAFFAPSRSLLVTGHSGPPTAPSPLIWTLSSVTGKLQQMFHPPFNSKSLLKVLVDTKNRAWVAERSLRLNNTYSYSMTTFDVMAFQTLDDLPSLTCVLNRDCTLDLTAILPVASPVLQGNAGTPEPSWDGHVLSIDTSNLSTNQTTFQLQYLSNDSLIKRAVYLTLLPDLASPPSGPSSQGPPPVAPPSPSFPTLLVDSGGPKTQYPVALPTVVASDASSGARSSTFSLPGLILIIGGIIGLMILVATTVWCVRRSHRKALKSRQKSSPQFRGSSGGALLPLGRSSLPYSVQPNAPHSLKSPATLSRPDVAMSYPSISRPPAYQSVVPGAVRALPTAIVYPTGQMGTQLRPNTNYSSLGDRTMTFSGATKTLAGPSDVFCLPGHLKAVWEEIALMTLLVQKPTIQIWVGLYKSGSTVEKVVVKKLTVEDTKAQESFTHEIAVTSVLAGHEAIVKLIGWVEEPLAMVLKQYPKSLDAILSDSSVVFSLKGMLVPLASAVLFMHGHLIVHQDIKAQNVFVEVGPDGHPRPVIGDFGISILLEASSHVHAQKNIRQFGFSIPYAAPEVLSGTLLTSSEPIPVANYGLMQAQDVYSLAIICWEVAHRVRVWNDLETERIIPAVLQGDRPAWKVGNASSEGQNFQLMDKLAALVERAWAALPEARPSAPIFHSELSSIPDIVFRV